MLRIVLVVCAVVHFAEGLFNSPTDSLELCNRKCEQKYDLILEDACIGGCRKGESKDLPGADSNECEVSCSTTHSGNRTLTNACRYGCDSYESKEGNNFLKYFKHIPEIIRNFYRKVVRRFKGSCAENKTVPVDENPAKVGIIVVRRFHIRWPVEDDEPKPQMMRGHMNGDGMMDEANVPEMMRAHGPMMMMHHRDLIAPHLSGRILPNVDRDLLKDETNAEENVPMPRVVAIQAPDPVFDEQLTYGIRFLGSHPVVLLFTVTLIALCVLFVVQLVIECRRRHRRANRFQYNRFDNLPTYVEATTVKVPSDDEFLNDKIEKPLKA